MGGAEALLSNDVVARGRDRGRDCPPCAAERWSCRPDGAGCARDRRVIEP